MNSTFDHTFSGFSVWIEPCPVEATAIVQKMNWLVDKCGGTERGMHEFAPHCTMLYNINPKTFIGNSRLNDDGSKNVLHSTSSENVGSSNDLKGKELLERCLREYKKSALDNNATDSLDEKKKDDGTQISIDLSPKSFFYFPYPKSADEGRGFGCLILLLLLENDANLKKMHSIASRVFPPDERHGSANDGGAGGDFIPHMALCYAPESDVWLESYRDVMEKEYGHLLRPLRGRYLSLWSTQGKISEWKRIAKVELE